MADVFVSYSRRDGGFVHRIADAIFERGGRDVWLDTEGIADAEVFPDAIKRAIEGSDAFVFVITRNSVLRTFVTIEDVERSLVKPSRAHLLFGEAALSGARSSVWWALTRLEILPICVQIRWV